MAVYDAGQTPHLNPKDFGETIFFPMPVSLVELQLLDDKTADSGLICRYDAFAIMGLDAM